MTYYSAPESITEGTCSYISDVYSLGLIFYEYVKRGTDDALKLYAIACKKDLSQTDLELKFEERLNFKEDICSLEMSMASATGMIYLTRSMLDPDPDSRIRLTQIMNHDAFKDINWKELGALRAPLNEN